MFTIIKDCSPYYITFTHDGFDDLVKYGREVIGLQNYEEYKFPECLSHVRRDIPTYKTRFLMLQKEIQDRLIELTPCSQKLDLNPESILYFLSNPGIVNPIHKDSPPTKPDRYSLNYPISILDDKCVTSWYSDSGINPYSAYSRIGIIENQEAVEVLASMTLKPNEAILLNSDIYHGWDNSQSTNDRIVLTFRDKSGDVYFDDAKRKLFNL